MADVGTRLADDDVTAAARKMAGAAVRRLPVIDGEGRLRGVLSMNDLALAAAKDGSIGPRALEVLIAACRHQAGEAAAGKQQGGSTAAAKAPATRSESGASGS
jgi:hypothetical protein